MTHHKTNKRRMMSKMIAGLFAGAMLCSGSIAIAGGGHRAEWSNLTEEQKLEKMEETLDKRMARLTGKLSLSNDQAAKLRGVFSVAQAEKQDIRQRHQDDREAARPEFKQLRERTKTQIAGILDADQIAIFDQLRRDRRGHRKDHKLGGRLVKEMTEVLALDASQQAQVAQIMESSRAEREGLVEAAGGDRKAARPQLKQLRERPRTQLRAVLTAEQATKFDAIKESRRGGKRHKKD